MDSREEHIGFPSPVHDVEGHYVDGLSSFFVTPLGPFGGHIAVKALQAAAHTSSLRQPTSWYCHFCNVPEIDSVEIFAGLRTRSRHTETIEVRIEQGGSEILFGLAWFTGELRGIDQNPHPRPQMASPMQFRSLEDLRPLPRVPFAEVRPAYELSRDNEARLSVGVGPVNQLARLVERDNGRFASWFRLRPEPALDDQTINWFRALLAADLIIPYAATIRLADRRIVLHTSVDMSVTFYGGGEDPSEWVYCEVFEAFARAGVAYGSTRIWSEDGELIAVGSEHMRQRIRL